VAQIRTPAAFGDHKHHDDDENLDFRNDVEVRKEAQPVVVRFPSGDRASRQMFLVKVVAGSAEGDDCKLQDIYAVCWSFLVATERK
jgi:hypothetical protein